MNHDEIQRDVQSFLACGGAIQQCNSADNAGATLRRYTRKEQLARRKARDTLERQNHRARFRRGSE